MAQKWVSYFNSKQGYDKLFLQFKKKYKSLGKIGGNISLDYFTSEEIEEFALFLGTTVAELEKKQKIQLQHFEQMLSGRKFEDIKLHQLLECYFNEKIQSNKEIREGNNEFVVNILSDCKKNYPILEKWISYIETKNTDIIWIWRLVRSGQFVQDIKIINDAISNLPSEVERLPLFSQKITGNPHRFDLNNDTGRLFLHALHIHFDNEGLVPKSTEQINELLLSANILRDDINNFVTFANLLGFIDGKSHPVLLTAFEGRCVLNLPLKELVKIKSLKLAHDEKCVFVVENSSVFSSLIDIVPDAPLVCTHGQFKLAGLRLLDMLVNSGYFICYSGDFDPEGIAMAQRLALRYPENFKYWRMSKNDYHSSGPVLELGNRINKLKSLIEIETFDLLQEIEKTKLIGYQEGLIELLASDLKNRNQN